MELYHGICCRHLSQASQDKRLTSCSIERRYTCRGACIAMFTDFTKLHVCQEMLWLADAMDTLCACDISQRIAMCGYDGQTVRVIMVLLRCYILCFPSRGPREESWAPNALFISSSVSGRPLQVPHHSLSRGPSQTQRRNNKGCNGCTSQ